MEASSSKRIRHRLSRSGDRKLNSALHVDAVTRIRMPHDEAMHCLKRKIDEDNEPHRVRLTAYMSSRVE